MLHDISNNSGRLINTAGFIVDIAGAKPFKKTVASWLDVKKLLQDRKLSGTVKIFRAWDQFELLSGEIAEVRRKIGLDDSSKRPRRRRAKIFNR